MPGADELAVMYEKPHDHSLYGAGHWLRVEQTIVLGNWLATDFALSTAADLSCGNGAILNRIDRLQHRVYGDFAFGHQIQGPIEHTIDQIHPVDLFVCSETIEHLDDPEMVLRKIRQKSRYLLLSTPIGENDLGNPEHLWGWDQDAVGVMLLETGWSELLARTDLVLPNTYSYQIWACR